MIDRVSEVVRRNRERRLRRVVQERCRRLDGFPCSATLALDQNTRPDVQALVSLSFEGDPNVFGLYVDGNVRLDVFDTDLGTSGREAATLDRASKILIPRESLSVTSVFEALVAGGVSCRILGSQAILISTVRIVNYARVFEDHVRGLSPTTCEAIAA